jgi:hypothetical protein
MGHGFELSQVHASGRLVMIATGVLTLLTVVIGFVAL